MHLLYLDDAGSAANAKEHYLVLGGLSVFEVQSHWITQELDRLAEDINPADPHSVEFHVSEIFSRRTHPWKRLSRDEARGTIKSVLAVLAEAYDMARAFACVVHKASLPNQDSMEIAFEDLCSRFDRNLQRLRASGDKQRRLVTLDKSTHETTLKRMSVGFRTLGIRWGVSGIWRIRRFWWILGHRVSSNLPFTSPTRSSGDTSLEIRSILIASATSSIPKTASSTGSPTRSSAIPMYVLRV